MAIDDRDQDIANAAILELIHHPEPELGALCLLDPDAEDLLGTIGQDAERDVHRLVAHEPLVADFDADRVEEDQRIAGVERRPCHSATASSTVSVTVEIRSGDTSIPYMSTPVGFQARGAE